MKDKLKEFEFNITAYHPDNKYTAEELMSLFIDWLKSLDMYCGGGINEL